MITFLKSLHCQQCDYYLTFYWVCVFSSWLLYMYLFFFPSLSPFFPAVFHLSPRPILKGTNINPIPACPPPQREIYLVWLYMSAVNVGWSADLSSINCRHYSLYYNKASNVCNALQVIHNCTSAHACCKLCGTIIISRCTDSREGTQIYTKLGSQTHTMPPLKCLYQNSYEQRSQAKWAETTFT